MVRRAARVTFDIALIAAVLVAGFIAFGVIGNRWYHIMSIASGSMEPTLPVGSLVVVTPAPAVLEPGMVITFLGDGRLITHRIVSVRSDGFPVTKGDANNAEDTFTKVTVVGLVAFDIPLLGFVLPSAHGSAASFVAQRTATQVISVGPFQLMPTPTPSPAATPTPPPSAPSAPDACAGVTFGRVIVGTAGDDVISAGNGGALVFGLGGNDTLRGGNGKDCLVGGDGNDVLIGGNGKDVLLGDASNDTLYGGGKKVIDREGGRDRLDGGDKMIDRGGGRDRLDGGDGIDTCYGTPKDAFTACEVMSGIHLVPAKPAPAGPIPAESPEPGPTATSTPDPTATPLPGPTATPTPSATPAA